MSEIITISKDEYIALLRCKAALAEYEIAEAKKPTQFVPRGEPQKWMSFDEVAEILRLHNDGMRSAEIAQRVGRPGSTVRRCIMKHRQEH
jgi:hypothetical protein